MSLEVIGWDTLYIRNSIKYSKLKTKIIDLYVNFVTSIINKFLNSFYIINV